MIRLAKIFLLSSFFFNLWTSCSFKNTEDSSLAIIPKVQSVSGEQSGKCGQIEFVWADDEVSTEIQSLFSSEFGLTNSDVPEKAIHLIVSSGINPEGYKLIIEKNEIKVFSSDAAGFFYALQSIKQLVDTKEGIVHLPKVKIDDYPRFKWRGLHLDVSRHFFGVKKVKEILDWMAYYKLNKFHWHLVDDQGWRIEIKKYPKLTEVGSTRIETDGSIRFPEYYTQDEIKEIVAYATERYIEIIPEIELPGHVTSALAAYPEFSCTQKTIPVGNTWGVFNDVYCAGNEEVFCFLEDVFTEVCELFPGKYIHVGGDECPKENWQSCAKCQQRIKDENLKNEAELQSYFIERISGFLHSKQKTVIAWDEIMEGYTPEDAVIMSWHGTECGEIAVMNGKPAVMTPSSHLYFNKYQGDMESEPLAMTGFIPLKKVYDLKPMPEGLSKEQENLVLGVQACLWTEHIEKESQLDYMLMPRLQALAEIAWTNKEQKDWHDFKKRLKEHYQILAEQEVNNWIEPPQGILNNAVFIEKKQIMLSTQEPDSKIFYSLNDGDFKEYTGPFEVTESTKLNTYTALFTGQKSIVQNISLNRMQPLKAVQPKKLKGPGIKVGKIDENEVSIELKVERTSEAREILGEAEKGIIQIETFLKVPKTGVYEFMGHPDQMTIDGYSVMNCEQRSKRIFYHSQVALEKGWHQLNATYFIRDYLAIPASKIKTELRWRIEDGEWEELKPYCYH